jgi:recombination protein RecT
MATSLAVKQAGTIQEFFNKYKDQVAQALPDHMKIGTFIRRTVSYVIRNPNIAQCSPISILRCSMQAASLGLQPDEIGGLCYLVPFYNNKTKVMEAQFIIGYKGLLTLATRSGLVSLVDAHIVYDQEPYTYEAGLDPVLKHKSLPPSVRGDKIVAAYAVAQMKDGSKKYVWLWYEEVLKVRDKSAGHQAFKAGKVKQSVWEDWHEIMCIKTAIRYLAKFLPQSPDLQQAVGYEESFDRGEPIKDFLPMNDDEPPEPEHTEKTEKLKEDLSDKLTAIQEQAKGSQGELGG